MSAPVIAVDYVKALPEQLLLSMRLRVLGTDGSAAAIRESIEAFFEVDTSLFIQCFGELVAAGHIQLNLNDVRDQLGIQSDKPNRENTADAENAE